jgi:hypothetical protein
MRIWLPIVLLSMLVTALAVSGREDAGAVPLVTIAEIHEDPWAWHGRRVRVVGSFDQCWGHSCAVCDAFETHVRLPDDPPRAYTEPSCGGVSFLTRDAGEAVARFNTVVLEAEYDADCSGVLPAVVGPDTVVVCTDRASEFRRAAVVEVLLERPATSLVPLMGTQVVSETPEPARSFLLDAYLGQFHPYRNRASFREDAYFVFEWSEMRGEQERTIHVGVCECRWGEACSDRWPTFRDHLVPARGNPYICHQAVLSLDNDAGAVDQEGTWYFPRQ